MLVAPSAPAGRPTAACLHHHPIGWPHAHTRLRSARRPKAAAYRWPLVYTHADPSHAAPWPTPQPPQVDVEDCCRAAEWLAAAGRVDPKRLCISGGSAGGFTTLACLAFRCVDGVGGGGGGRLHRQVRLRSGGATKAAQGMHFAGVRDTYVGWRGSHTDNVSDASH